MSFVDARVPWEAGSESHFGSLSPGGTPDHPWNEHILCGSARAALKLLMRSLVKSAGRRRIWLPSYMCREVTDAVELELECCTYFDLPLPGTSPDYSGIDWQVGDTLVVVNQFGVRLRSELVEVRRRGVVVVEDHTHDPWSDWARQSEADYCLASVRKVLPIPDGAVLWSPQGSPLPEAPPLTYQGLLASSNKLSAMLLKAHYLRGEFPSKSSYLELFRAGEAGMGMGEPSSATRLSAELLGTMDVTEWRAQRRRNLALFASQIREASGLTLLDQSQVPQGQVPLGCIVVARDTAMRDHLRSELINKNIYTAILWPLGPFDVTDSTRPDVDFSTRMLFVHVDGRYSPDDLERTAHVLLEACRGYA